MYIYPPGAMMTFWWHSSTDLLFLVAESFSFFDEISSLSKLSCESKYDEATDDFRESTSPLFWDKDNVSESSSFDEQLLLLVIMDTELYDNDHESVNEVYM